VQIAETFKVIREILT